MTEAWILEEELIINMSLNPNLNPELLDKIAVRVVYLNAQQEILEVVPSSIDLIQGNIDWGFFKKDADIFHFGEQKYEIGEIMCVHIVKTIDELSGAKYDRNILNPVIPFKEFKLLSTLNIFHDFSELFVFLKPIVELKSILKKDGISNYSKTKRVQIQEGESKFKKTRRRKDKK